MAYATGTITGTYKSSDGTAAQGVGTITPTSLPIVDAADHVILAGPVAVKLDASGALVQASDGAAIVLAATDDVTLNPTGFGYTLKLNLYSATLASVSFALPGGTTVDLSTVTPVDPSTFVPVATYATTGQLNAETTRATTAEATKVDKGLPSYVTGAHSNYFNAGVGAYNFKTTNTRLLRAGLGNAATGGLSQWVIVGDSEGAGCTNGAIPTYDRPNAWPMAMRNELARHGIPVGGSGLIRIVDNTVNDARWAKSGVWNDTGLWYSFTVANAATRTFTSDIAGDHISVLYYDSNDGATFTTTVNGVNQGTTTSGGGTGLKVASYAAAIAVGQTVVITDTLNAKIVDIIGVQVWNAGAGGLIIHNLSQSGATASGTGAASWSDASAVTSLGSLISTGNKFTTSGAVTPDCVIIALGGNDHPVSGASIATIQAAITTIRGRFPNSDCILVAPTPLVTSVVTKANWESYVSGLYDLADTLDVPLLDFRARMGDYATIVANGQSVDGQGHLIVGAAVALGRGVGAFVAN